MSLLGIFPKELKTIQHTKGWATLAKAMAYGGVGRQAGGLAGQGWLHSTLPFHLCRTVASGVMDLARLLLGKKGTFSLTGFLGLLVAPLTPEAECPDPEKTLLWLRLES